MADDVFDSLGALLGSVLGSAGTQFAENLEMAYDEGIIEDILKVLDEGVESLSKGEDLPDPDPVAFGTSPTGTLLAHNAALARQKVIEAITDMRTGLHGYREVVAGFRADATQADETSEGGFSTLQSAMGCVNQPTIAAPSQCTAPPAGGGS